ncbi:hypothetical protein QNM99_09450 [Pseudomonas sp. PCH446]
MDFFCIECIINDFAIIKCAIIKCAIVESCLTEVAFYESAAIEYAVIQPGAAKVDVFEVAQVQHGHIEEARVGKITALEYAVFQKAAIENWIGKFGVFQFTCLN